MWGIYAIIITRRTNHKYFLFTKDIYDENERKRYRNSIMKQHILKVFLGLLVVLVLILLLIYIQLNYINLQKLVLDTRFL